MPHLDGLDVVCESRQEALRVVGGEVGGLTVRPVPGSRRSRLLVVPWGSPPFQREDVGTTYVGYADRFEAVWSTAKPVREV